MKYAQFLFLAAILPFGCTADESAAASRASKLEAALSDARIGLAEAVQSASEANPDATVWKAELTVDDSPNAFEVVVIQGSDATELTIDPKSGKITGTEAEDDSVPAICAVEVTANDAIATAEKKVGGDAVEFESKDCEVDVLVLADGKLLEVELSSDGSVVKVSAEEGDDENEQVDDDDDNDNDDEADTGGSNNGEDEQADDDDDNDNDNDNDNED